MLFLHLRSTPDRMVHNSPSLYDNNMSHKYGIFSIFFSVVVRRQYSHATVIELVVTMFSLDNDLLLELTWRHRLQDAKIASFLVLHN